MAEARHRLVDATLGLVALGLVAMAFVMTPSSGSLTVAGSTKLQGLCWVHELLGVPCPFCGMSRSFVAVAHGRLGDALAWHPAGPLLFLAAVAAVVAVALTLARRARPLCLRPSFLRVMNIVALVAVLAGAARWLVR